MIYNKLYGFQKDAIKALEGKEAAGLFLDMGLGKTITSLAKIQKDGFDPNKHKLLIVCLAGTAEAGKTKDWYDYVKKHYNIEPKLLIKGSKINEKLLKQNNHVIISFESCWRIEKAFMSWIDSNTWIIVDESHKMKTPKSKITKALLNFSTRTKNKLLLTGTPITKGFEDLFTQLKFLGYDISKKEFYKRYVVEELMELRTGSSVNRFRKIIGYRNTEELMNITHDKAVFVKTEDAYDLPEKTFIPIIVPKTSVFNKFKKDRVMDDIVADSPGQLRLRLKQLSSNYMGNRDKFFEYGMEKRIALKNLLLENDQKIVVFYNGVPEAIHIAEVCKDLQRPFSYYNGEIKDLSSIKDPSCKNGVLITQYKSGSTGINLTESNIIIFYSPTDMHEHYAQAIKRIHRIGQTNHCLYYQMIMESSIDPRIYKALEKGKDYDDALFEYEMENNYI